LVNLEKLDQLDLLDPWGLPGQLEKGDSPERRDLLDPVVCPESVDQVEQMENLEKRD